MRAWHLLTDLKNLSRGLLVLFALTIALLSAQPDKIFAQVPCAAAPAGSPWGRLEDCGYFLNRFVDASGVGLLTGIPSPRGTGLPWQEAMLGVNTINQFVDVIRYHLQGCTPDTPSVEDNQRRNAAAFIILTMLSAPAGTPADAPCVTTTYNVNVWEARVREYANYRAPGIPNGLIDFNDTASYTINTRVQRVTQDIAWYSNVDTQPSIVVHAPDGTELYAIKKNCANPVGRPRAIPPLSLPGTITCTGVDINPDIPQAGEAFTIRANFTTSGGVPPGQLEYYTVDISLNGPAGSTGRFTNRRGAAFEQTSRSGGAGSGAIPGFWSPLPDPITIPTPGVYSGSYVVTMNGMSDSPQTCPYTVTIANIPYHRVYGGDTFAGAGFRYGLNCRTDTFARIYGVTRSPGALTGAGSQLAAMALGLIHDFPTGVMRTNASATDPDHLSFANNGPVGSSGASPFGGGLAQNHAVCAADYYGQGPAGIDLGADPTILATDLRPGLQAQGNVVIEGRTLGAGAQQTIYVDGNAFITGPIRFLTAGVPIYGSRAEIPSFRLIVKGNIYVEPNVDRIDGVYIAQADEAVSGDDQGRFYTCGARAFASGPGTANPYAGFAPNANHLNGACRTRLTVYGAVIAEVIKLTRTAGTLLQSPQAAPFETYNSGGGPAEVFVFSPEVWLNGEFTSSGEFDAVTALPPVL